MIPQLVTVHHRRAGGRPLRLCIPVVPVALLLSPLLALALLAGLIACLALRVNPLGALGALGGIGRLLCALPGTQIEVDQGGTAVRVSVR